MVKWRGRNMVRVCNMIAHDALVELVEEEMESRGYTYPNIEKLTEYRSPNGDGEIDLFVKHGNYILLFEMKCTDSYRNRDKSKKQMIRAEKNYFSKFEGDRKIFKFYATYDKKQGDGYKINWVKS